MWLRAGPAALAHTAVHGRETRKEGNSYGSHTSYRRWRRERTRMRGAGMRGAWGTDRTQDESEGREGVSREQGRISGPSLLEEIMWNVGHGN